MKSKLELQEQRSELVAQNVTLLQNAKNETRSVSDSDHKQMSENTEKIKKIDSQIEALDKELRNETEQVNGKTKIEMKEKGFNLLSAIRNRAEGRSFTDAEKKVIDAGHEEMRHAGINPEGDIIIPSVEKRADILAGTATAGAEVVAEDKLSILAPLREALVTVKAGATFMTGLVGDVSIPTYAGTTAAWKGEVAAADDGGGAFGEVAFSPLRLTAYVDISKRFLLQDSASAEALLKQDIVNAVAGKLESTLFSTSAASAGVSPAGLFTGTVSDSGAATHARVVALETGVDTQNALLGNLSYITNATQRGNLKTLKIDAGSGQFVMDGQGNMNGYPTHVTNHVSSTVNTSEDGIAFANWADLIIAQWGGIDLLVDPYTQAANGQVRLVVNAYFDAKFRRSESVSVASFA